MKAIVFGKKFQAKKVGNKYFYYGPKAMRWLPVSKDAIVYE